MLRCHILPAFGSHRLDAISRIEVKAFARALANDLAPVTVRSIVTVLGLVLREAIDEHYLLFDPTARLRLRDRPSEPRPTATPNQVRRLVTRMPNLQAHMLVIAPACTGMRGRARRARQVLTSTSTVPRSTSPPTPAPGTRSAVTGGSASPRPRPLSATSGYRRSWSTAWTGCCAPTRLRPCSAPIPADGCDCGGPPSSNGIWRPACDGHPVYGWDSLLTGFWFHDLRHTHRTWMGEDGVAEPLKSQRLGHQLLGIPGIYAHVTEPMHPPPLAALQDRWLENDGCW